MTNFFNESLFSGVTISFLAYLLGMALEKKFKLGILNPLLISIVFTILVLVIAHVDYETYNRGATYLSWFLTPATVCLAIPLYEQWQLLKENLKAVLLSILAGVITSLTTIFILAKYYIYLIGNTSLFCLNPSQLPTVWDFPRNLVAMLP